MRELLQSVPALVVVVVTIVAVIVYVGSQIAWVSRTRREGRRLAGESDRLAKLLDVEIDRFGPDPGRLETR